MLSAITVSARSNYNLPRVSESEMLQGNISPSVSPSLVLGWLKMKEGPPLASTKVSSRPIDIWNTKQQASVTSTAWRWQNPSRFHYLCSARCWINASLCFCSKGIPLDSPSVSRNGKCVQFYTSRSGAHFEGTPSFAAFLAPHSLSANYVSGRTPISPPTAVNHTVPDLIAQSGCETTGLAIHGYWWAWSLRVIGRRSSSSEGGEKKVNMKVKRLSLPFNALAASWFLLDRNTKTKERLSPRLRSLDQIHPGTKQEQLPLRAVPACTLCEVFPSWRFCSHALLKQACCLSPLLAAVWG